MCFQSLTGNKDVDRLIVSYLDSKDIFEFCKTCKYANRQVCNEHFFRNLVYNKYQNTIKYKDYVKTTTFRQYYYSVVYYIDKLEKEYNFDYSQEFQNSEVSPELEYLWRKILPNYEEYSKNRALYFASERGNLSVVKYLVEQKANIDFNYSQPLRISSENGHLAVVKFLVEQGADIDASNGYSLKSASLNGHLSVVKFLTERGADVDAYKLAIRYASRNEHTEVVKYLESLQ